MEKSIKIGFYGGANSTTGSNFYLSDIEDKTKILSDCGLFQGRKIGEDVNREKFLYNPAEIDYLFVTHAHIDHIGRIPKLVKDGFRGKIISTAPTKDISELMLMDSMGILGKEAKYDKLPPLYEEEDVRASMDLWSTQEYGEEIKSGEFNVVFRDAGHILGSSYIEFEHKGKRVVFSGDLGNSPAPLLRDTEDIKNINVLVIESVYGDRNHELREERKHMLEDAIEDTIKAGGALMIPAFSLERTQQLLFELNDLVENGRIPDVPIFIDSPLAIDVTKIYKKYENHFNEKTRDIIKSGDDIFNFPGLKFTYKTEESKAIANVPNPKVILAGSGMSNGGRIVHHEKKYLPDSASTLLVIGYQVPGSLGRRLQDGDKNVKILGDHIPVRAKIKTIRGYSAHKDSDDLVNFVDMTSSTLEQVFVVLGEPKSESFLAQKIRDNLGIKAVVPSPGSVVEL